MMFCARCHNEILDSELYFEAKRRGEHDVYRQTDTGYEIRSVPLAVHVDCPTESHS